MHLMKRALQTTHFQFAEECFGAITKGYAAVVGEDEEKDVLAKIREIDRRGRYVAERRESEIST
jgi:TP53 regulating kinase-like protein